MNRATPAGSTLLRRQEILAIVGQGTVQSQEELQEILRRRGFAVAQPTLSRDLRVLSVVKTPAGYALPALVSETQGPAASVREERLIRALRDSALSVERAGTLVVIKTPPASANPLARAIDSAALPEVAGSVAGDDTIFVAARSAGTAARLARRLLEPIRPSPRPRRRRR